MFTGLIADLGRVERVEADDDGATLQIATALADELREGDSIAVDGVCLTAVAIAGATFRTQAMHQTLRASSLAAVQRGDEVNLELALRAADRLGGHIVQGHVDGTGTVAAVREDGFSRVVEVDVAPELARYVVDRGSIAMSGVSLTISALLDRGFAVSLIPETLERTNLGRLAPGAPVNIEVDILAKHVERLMEVRA
ncbi:MAG TPA: riboflavin synthase [Solirubrobacteraceae bacterium]|jgi:riboflavin synthase|nr:riboflavin synthase [Solirubrobacteraceae bacterium]